MKKYIIISLGGSLIVPKEIDTDFLRDFIKIIKISIKKGHRFVIITGGGKISRKYTNTAKEISRINKDNLDWLGIAVTRLNAELLRVIFKEIAYEKVLLNPDIIPKTNKAVIIGAGWKPGNSSDLAAVHSAKSFGAKKVINLSNIDFVYDKDPNKYSKAKPVKKISWNDFINIIPKNWDPGINVPFDPIASRKAKSLGLEVIIMNGKNLNNLKNYLDLKNFIGTVIK